MAPSDTRPGGILRSPAFLVACGGVALLAIGGAVAVSVLTGVDGESAAAPVATADPAPEAPAAPQVPPAPAMPKDPRQVQAAHALEAARPNLARMVPSRGRFMITRAIQLQGSELARCFPGRDLAAPSKPVVSRRSLVSPDSPGVIRLELEPSHGEIFVLDATVEQRGTGSPEQLACACRALKGLALEMPGTTPGDRVSMLYPLP